MFKTASFCRISTDSVIPALDALEKALQSARFVPCGATQPESYGWVPPRGNKSTVLAESVGGQIIMKLCVERRPVPGSAIKAGVEERIEKYKKETGNERVASKLKKEFKEEVLFELLPRAFTKRSTTLLWLDPKRGLLIADTASAGGADRLVTCLLDAIAEIPGAKPMVLKPVQTVMSASASMSHWLTTQEAPNNFTIDQDCELKSTDSQKSVVRYTRHTLELEEVAKHIQEGKLPTQLALTWNDRVSFVLTEGATIRKLQMLDVVMEGVDKPGKDDDGFDADAAILTGELSELIPDLLDALGGEAETGVGAPVTETGAAAPVEEVRS